MAIKVFLFGFPKSGKTTNVLKNIAEQGLRCNYIDLEQGTRFIKKNYSDCKSINFLTFIKEVKEKTELLVIDSITKAQALCDINVAKGHEVQDISEIAYGKGTKLSSSLLIETLNKADTLCDVLLVIGHCSIQVLQKEKGAVSVKNIKLHTDTLDFVATEFDAIGFYENEIVHFSKDKATKLGGCRFLMKIT